MIIERERFNSLTESEVRAGMIDEKGRIYF